MNIKRSYDKILEIKHENFEEHNILYQSLFMVYEKCSQSPIYVPMCVYIGIR